MYPSVYFCFLLSKYPINFAQLTLFFVVARSRWIDFENDYKTLNLSFMESVWWVFAECWRKRVNVNGEDRSLIYRDFKVLFFALNIYLYIYTHHVC